MNAATSMATPILYEAGPKAYYFNFRTFWKWMLYAFYHGWVCYFLPILAFRDGENASGRAPDHWFVSTISFTLCLHIVTYKLFLESYFWSSIAV